MIQISTMKPGNKMNGDMRGDFDPFQEDEKWWYWLTDDTKAGPFKTERAASLSAHREARAMQGDEE